MLHKKARDFSSFVNGNRLSVVSGTFLVLFITSFTLRYFAFNQTSYANGWDGYFYINQVRSFMEEGRMDVPDFSLVYPLMMLIRLFTDDYVLSYKLMGCILAGALTASLFMLALKWAKNYRVALFLGTVSLFSPHLTYFAAQYPKNLLGVVFFIWLLYSVDSKNKILPVLLLVVNFFGHRVTAVLGFMFLLTYTFLQRATRFTPYIVVLFFVLLVAGGFLLPGIISLFDIERFQGVISMRPQFAPYSFVTSFGPGLISTWWLIEIIVCCIVFFIAVVFAVRLAVQRKYQLQLTIILLILAFLIFPFFNWSIDGPAFRFLVMFILLCPLLLIFLLESMKTNYALEGLCVALVISSLFSYSSYDPARHDPPYKLYDIVARQILSKVEADSCDLIIAHKSLAEYIVYSTGIDAMSWVPEYELESSRLWRVAEGVKDIQFGFYLDPDDLAFVHRLTPSYSLVREDRWEKFTRRVATDGNEELLRELSSWKNPDRVRPNFMLKNKRF